MTFECVRVNVEKASAKANAIFTDIFRRNPSE